MTSPTNLKYIKDHDWACFEANGTATLGVTDFAQESLGDVVFVELREIGEDLRRQQMGLPQRSQKIDKEDFSY